MMIAIGRTTGTKALAAVALLAAAAFSILAAPQAGVEVGIAELERAYKQVTPEDLATVHAQAETAIAKLGASWVTMLLGHGSGPPPSVFGCRPPDPSAACANVHPMDAFYNRDDGTIHYDERLAAALMRLTRERRKTRGTYGAVVILAHEWGHALSHRLNEDPRILEEARADCFAGAFTRALSNDGVISASDVEDGRYTITMVSDKQFYAGGIPRPQITLAGDVHGDKADRLQSFGVGFKSGVNGCTNKLK
jgi:hypothetical protein